MEPIDQKTPNPQFDWRMVVFPIVALPLTVFIIQCIPFVIIFYFIYKVIIEKHGEGEDFGSRFTWNNIQNGLQNAVTDLISIIKEYWKTVKEIIYPIYQSWCFRNPVDLIETEDMFVAEIELPGYTKNDINVSVNGLTVEVSASKEREEKKYLIRERTFRPFKRCITFPGNADLSTIMAKTEDGILIISASKQHSTNSNNKTIKIE